jgi:uncharacterized protein (TIGR02147 family)
MVSIFDYFDYQLFLKDHIDSRKKGKTWFSYRYLAAKLSMDHSNLIKIVLGKRHASGKNVIAITKVLKFNPKEAEYFKTLVEFNKTKNQAKTKLLFEKLVAIKNISLKKLEPNQYDYYRHWYYTAIYSLLDYYEFTDDYAALAAEINPPITVKQARETIELLEKLLLIRKEKDGRYVQSEKLISTGQRWHSVAIQTFQEETLKLAISSLSNHPKNVRDISTLTMSLGKPEMEAIRELSKQYRKSIIKVISESGPGDSVYQLNMQFFPLTKPAWSLQ